MDRDPREQVRDLIAEKLAEADRRAVFVPDGADRDALEYCHRAEVVMELFEEVEVRREHHSPGWIMPVPFIPVPSHGPGGMVATHKRLMLSTAPQPVDREG